VSDIQIVPTAEEYADHCMAVLGEPLAAL